MYVYSKRWKFLLKKRALLLWKNNWLLWYEYRLKMVVRFVMVWNLIATRAWREGGSLSQHSIYCWNEIPMNIKTILRLINNTICKLWVKLSVINHHCHFHQVEKSCSESGRFVVFFIPYFILSFILITFSTSISII